MKVVIKVKIMGEQHLKILLDGVVSMGDLEFAELVRNHFDTTAKGEQRELACLNMSHNQTWRAILPRVYLTLNDPSRDVYAVAMEYLRDVDAFTHLDTVEDVTVWSEADINDVFQGIAAIHALYYGNTNAIPDEIKKYLNMIELSDIYQNRHHQQSFIRMVKYVTGNHSSLLETTGTKQVLQNSIDNIDQVCAILCKSPATLVHNDFSVRNVCLRRSESPPKRGSDTSRVIVYDWEFARIMVPQHDIAEFIAFVLPERSKPEAWEKYMEMYREIFFGELEKLGVAPELLETVSNKEKFRKVFHMCVIEFVWNRLGGYMYMAKMIPQNASFLARVSENVYNYMGAFAKEYTFLAD